MGVAELSTVTIDRDCSEALHGTCVLLCATSVFSVPLWFIIASKNNHGDTEDTEVAQRGS